MKNKLEQRMRKLLCSLVHRMETIYRKPAHRDSNDGYRRVIFLGYILCEDFQGKAKKAPAIIVGEGMFATPKINLQVYDSD